MDKNISVYWDFENIHASLCTLQYGQNWYRTHRNELQPKLVNINSVMEFIAALGQVNLNKGYADWSVFQKYSPDLQEFSVDLIQLFPRGRHGKNGADIRMAIDVVEDLNLHPHIGTVVIIGGDSDYIAIAQKVRQQGRSIIGIGVKETTNQYWIKSCNEFKFYASLLMRSSSSVEIDIESGSYDQEDLELARQLLINSVSKIIAKSGDDYARKAMIKPMMIRLDSSFDETNYGFLKFSQFLENCRDIIDITPGESDHLIRLRDNQYLSKSSQSNSSTINPYQQILKKQGIKLPPPELLRLGILHTFDIFQEQSEVSSYQDYRHILKERLNNSGMTASDSDVSKIKAILFKSFAFVLNRDQGTISLASDIESKDELYQKTIDFLGRRVIENLVEDIDLERLNQMLISRPEDLQVVKGILEDIEA